MKCEGCICWWCISHINYKLLQIQWNSFKTSWIKMRRLCFAFELTSSSVTWSVRDYPSNSLDKRVSGMNVKGLRLQWRKLGKTVGTTLLWHALYNISQHSSDIPALDWFLMVPCLIRAWLTIHSDVGIFSFHTTGCAVASHRSSSHFPFATTG